MFMTFVMFMFYNLQPNGQYIYKEPLMACARATYEGSEAKFIVEKAGEKIRDKYPVPSKVLATGYSLGIQRKVMLVSPKIVPIKDSRTSIYADKQTISVSVSWNF